VIDERPLASAGVTWRDQTGKVWEIHDMETSHLENACNWMLTNADNIQLRDTMRIAGLPGPNGDAANDAFDVEFDLMMQATPEDYVKQFYSPYKVMQAELRRRYAELERRREEYSSFVDDLEQSFLNEKSRLGIIIHRLAEQLAANVDMHVCRDCGGDEAWAEEAAAFLKPYFFENDQGQIVLNVEDDVEDPSDKNDFVTTHE
jgi:hypothetical protein